MKGFISRIMVRVFSKSLQRRWDALLAGGKLFGSLAKDDEKLFHLLKDEIRSRMIESAKNRQKKVMSSFIQLRARKIKPVKVFRKILIVTGDTPSHRELAQRCLESAKQYGEEDGLEISTPEEDLDLLDSFKRNRLTWNNRDTELFIYHSKIKNFYLHFQSWLKCAELDEPMLLMQQGCLFRSNVPELRFKDVIVLGSPYNVSSGTPEKREVFYPRRSLEDAYCYAVTPRGARKLLEAARKDMVQSLGKFVCKRYVDVICCTEQARPVDFLSQLSMPKDIVQPQEEVWKSYEHTAGG